MQIPFVTTDDIFGVTGDEQPPEIVELVRMEAQAQAYRDVATMLSEMADREPGSKREGIEAAARIVGEQAIQMTGRSEVAVRNLMVDTINSYNQALHSAALRPAGH